ncbi:MAG: acyl-CoA dehydrogenase family protein [Longimicrobiales bacterium]
METVTAPMNEALEQVRELAHQFAAAELRPHVERWDHERRLDTSVLPQLAELGFFGMLGPESHGGLDFDLPTYLAVLEELAWGEPAVALTLSIHSAFGIRPLLRHGTAAQQERWLRPLATGQLLACFALSEPGAGSDAAAVETTARRAGDGWVIDGQKKWVTNGAIAGLAVVIARTAEAPGPRSLAAFLVPTEAEGVEVGARESTMGLRASEVVSLHLHGVHLGADALLGAADRGFHLAMEGLDLGRLGVAAQAIGIARAALEHALAYAAEREQFGQPIREFEAIQFKLADMATRTEAAQALLRRAAQAPSTRLAAMAKLFASECATEVTRQAVQVFGGYGYMRDYPVEKLMRDAKATEIYEGTSEIQRVVIARALFGRPA